MKNASRIIGLTGGIGAGKSAASSRFFALGAALIDADVLARSALDIGGICYEETVNSFGPDILLPDGRIDRRALASIVFSDEAKRQTLNGIIHPRVISFMLEQARAFSASNKQGVIILDVPLLFECGMDRDVDETVLVYADEKTRVERVAMRDGCAAEDARARIRAQMPQEEKMRLAGYTLNNNGPLEALLGQTDALYQLFRSKLY